MKKFMSKLLTLISVFFLSASVYAAQISASQCKAAGGVVVTNTKTGVKSCANEGGKLDKYVVK